ncbi:MAG: DUF2147 domain-containing protein [Saprospiraceae bacterium]|nr:DUF2147 domain-containing protein [Saprospiraceae bacterium]
MENLPGIEIYPYVFLHDFLRYFLAASTAYLLFWVIFKKQWQHRMVQQKWPKASRKWSEFKYSMSTVVIFSLVGFSIVQLKLRGYTQLYDDIADYGWTWFVTSLVFMFVAHDAYYYWVHRWMHHPRLFKYVHLVHHKSTNPSPWAAYSFHPIEALLEALIYVIFVFCIPLHGLALMIFLISMIVRNVLSHLGMEILPNWFIRSKWLNWMTTTTHHDLHHKNFNTNYGIYFTWWDRWFGTEDKAYVQTFEEVTKRPKEPTSRVSPKLSKVNSTLVFFLFIPALQGQSPIGLWQTIDDKTGEPVAMIEIKEKAGKLEGQIVELLLVTDDMGNPICSACEGERRGEPVIGMDMIWGFDSSGRKGKILDPEGGEIYHSKMWLSGDDQLKVRGYAGPFNLFYRTQTWRRMGPQIAGSPFRGLWKTIDDRSGLPMALVEIRMEEDELKGRIKELYPLPWEGNDPICVKCPGEKRNQKMVGMTILWNFRAGQQRWKQGKLLDPGNGKIYTGALWLESRDRLKVRGYLGPFYRTQTWNRVKRVSQQ